MAMQSGWSGKVCGSGVAGALDCPLGGVILGSPGFYP